MRPSMQESHKTGAHLPRQHHKHLKRANMLERLNEEIRRRTHLVRIFPNGESCLRLVRALAVETHENWLEQHRYLNMDDLRDTRRRCAVRPDPRPVQPSTVLALSRTLRAGSAGAAAVAAASLTAAARGALPDGRSGRRDGPSAQNQSDVSPWIG
jgi:hypothetical protein